MKAMLREVNDHGLHYQCLMFWCPGCEHVHEVTGERSGGLHMLPVNTTEKSPSWTFDGDLEAPTLSPSILTKWGPVGTSFDSFVCHSFLHQGVFNFLGDCTHQYVNQHVPLPDLPDWVTKDYDVDDVLDED